MSNRILLARLTAPDDYRLTCPLYTDFEFDPETGRLETASYLLDGTPYTSSYIAFLPTEADALALIVNAYNECLDRPELAELIGEACRAAIDGDKRGFIHATVDLLNDEGIDFLLEAMTVVV